MKFETYPQVEGKERLKKETPDWQGAVLINKGNYIKDLSWATIRQVDLCTSPPEP